MAVEKFPVEAGQIMLFARAVGDPNPVYHDAASQAAQQQGGVIAPPTFVQSSAQYDPDYPLRPKIGQVWFGSGRTPSGLMPDPDAPEKSEGATISSAGSSGASGGGGTGLHAEQHFTYHRPLRAGELLTVTSRPGERWEKQGRRGGLLQFQEGITEYRDAEGALVVTARSVGVRTGQTVKEA
jgi:hypothetical protein